MLAKAKQIEAGGQRAAIAASVSTLPTDGISMWAQGQLEYDPGGVKGLVFGFPSLKSNGFSMTCYYSNRRGSNGVVPPGTIGGCEQLFFEKTTSKLKLTITPSRASAGR